jgi:hypothetical protein
LELLKLALMRELAKQGVTVSVGTGLLAKLETIDRARA